MALVKPTDTTHHENKPDRPGAALFVYDVDGTTYGHNRPTISGLEIMDAASIQPSDGLVQILDDGTTRMIEPDEVVRLVPKARFKRRPRFKRG
jgi:hypothetical protein